MSTQGEHSTSEHSTSEHSTSEHSTSAPEASGGGLDEREQQILRFIVQRFVETAGPIASGTLEQDYPEIGLSSASIRNTMSALEEQGYLNQPHTSAGRVPTERGYRAFVDELMEQPTLSAAEQRSVEAILSRRVSDVEELLRESSRLLGQLTNLLGMVLSPMLSDSVLERIDLVPVAADRLMFVLSVRGGLVKTIVLESREGAAADLHRHDLGRVVSILNERLGGLTLAEIRRTFPERTGDLENEDPAGVVRLMRDEAALLFSEPAEGRLRHGGARNLVAQPEFQEADDLRALIEMIEDEPRVVRLLEEVTSSSALPDGDDLRHALVSIGREHRRAGVERYSIVTSRFRRGSTIGTVGVLGPTRMNYGRVMALVENTARLMSRSSAAADA